MLIKICKYEYLESSIMEIDLIKLQASQAFFDMILSDPDLKELTAIADSYGLYSSLFIHESNVFFVYGKNRKQVTASDYVYYEGNIYPIDYFQKNGVLSHEGFMLTGWNSVLISNDHEIFDAIKNSMRILSLFCNIYLKVGFDYLPDAFVWNEDVPSMELYKKLLEIQSLDVSKPRKQTKCLDKIYPFIKDIAVWEWPISPTNFRKCGFTAFIQSPYCPFLKCRDPYKHAKRVYSDISLWEITKGQYSQNSE